MYPSTDHVVELCKQKYAKFTVKALLKYRYVDQFVNALYYMYTCSCLAYLPYMFDVVS